MILQIKGSHSIPILEEGLKKFKGTKCCIKVNRKSCIEKAIFPINHKRYTICDMNSKLSIIVAIDKNRLIGGKNKLLWNIPGELKRFKEITTGHPIIMGRKTHESIGRVLPNRANIIISHSSSHERPRLGETIWVSSLNEAIEAAKEFPGSEEIFIIGGGQIYAQALPLADRLYLTIVDGEYEGDTYFPEYSDFKKVIEEKEFEENGICYKTQILEKN